MHQTRSGTGTFGKRRRYMGGTSLAAALVIACLLMVGSRGAAAAAPAGEMRWALYVTFPPAWLDPAEVAVAGVTPFWVIYALHDPAKAKQLLAEAGYPNGFETGDLPVVPPYFDMGDAIVNYLMAVGIRMKSRPMERAAFFAALNAKQRRGVCVCGSGRYGNAATRLEEMAVTWGSTAYGGHPDIDALFKQQDVETDRGKREALLHQIQQLIHERVMFGPIWEYIWPSAVGPRVEEPALMLINPYPWSAPLEDVRLKPE